MARSRARRTVHTVTPDAFAKLQRALEHCAEEVEHLKHEVEISIRRMAAMQAEIDDLRAKPR